MFAAEGCSSAQELEKSRPTGGNFSSEPKNKNYCTGEKRAEDGYKVDNVQLARAGHFYRTCSGHSLGRERVSRRVL